MSRDASFFGSVLARLPSATRKRAGRATVLRAAGYDDSEIAVVLGVNRRTLHRDRQTLRQALVDVLDADGLTAREIGLTGDEIPCPKS